LVNFSIVQQCVINTHEPTHHWQTRTLIKTARGLTNNATAGRLFGKMKLSKVPSQKHHRRLRLMASLAPAVADEAPCCHMGVVFSFPFVFSGMLG
jgi:hypothetical protein